MMCSFLSFSFIFYANYALNVKKGNLSVLCMSVNVHNIKSIKRAQTSANLIEINRDVFRLIAYNCWPRVNTSTASRRLAQEFRLYMDFDVLEMVDNVSLGAVKF